MSQRRFELESPNKYPITQSLLASKRVKDNQVSMSNKWLDVILILLSTIDFYVTPGIDGWPKRTISINSAFVP